MRRYAPQLDRIDAQRERWVRLLVEWSRINSGSHNLAGLERCAAAILREFAPLADEALLVELPQRVTTDAHGNRVAESFGKAIRLSKRPGVSPRALLCIHYDTVYAADDPFQDVTWVDERTLRGPGVADAKGGIVVLLAALEALEASDAAGRIGWDVVLNSDEELGSPGSSALLEEVARGCDVGLLFEPSLPDGALVAARKGSGNFTATVTGLAAHAGRDPQNGRNAIHALAEFVVAVAGMNDPAAGLTVNVGRIEGGGAVNVVPDRAVCRFNVRVATPGQQREVEAKLAEIATGVNARDGVSLHLAGGFTAPPKPVTDTARKLMDHVTACGRELGMDLAWRNTGGTCDGNRLAAAGLANVDSLGVVGGELHSPREYCHVDSILERAKLLAMVLSELPLPRGGEGE